MGSRDTIKEVRNAWSGLFPTKGLAAVSGKNSQRCLTKEHYQVEMLSIMQQGIF